MSEQLNPYYPEAVDMAWNAALSSNDAFDDVQRAQRDIDKIQAVQDMGIHDLKLTAAIDQKRAAQGDAYANHLAFASMAGVLMTAEDSPFAFTPTETETEPVMVGAISFDTLEKFR